jgi:hypothetical protein
MKSWESDRAVYENYNAITGRGNDVRSSDAYYCWGALLGALSLIEKGMLSSMSENAAIEGE